MTEIVPTIIPESLDHIRDEICAMRDHVKTIQIDIMDGKFSPKPSWPFSEQPHLPETGNLASEFRIGLELDMLVQEPIEYIQEWIPLGIHTFIIHVDSTEDLKGTVDAVLALDRTVALALKPSHDIAVVDAFIDRIHFVQVMGNDKVGFNGVELSNDALVTISALRERYPDLIIGIDIGVNFETAPKIVAAGANRLASGSAVNKAENRADAIRKLSLN